ncbi:MAG TPA: hypothetical protein VM012_13620 [Flavitalea sp.]|nr:hypothetical protein [Flavitalea sp.]
MLPLCSQSQDLTGTWEGTFVKGTTGLHRLAYMRWELIEVEGKIYGIFTLYPDATKTSDRANAIYTLEGKRKSSRNTFLLYKGRTVESRLPESNISSGSIVKSPPVESEFQQFNVAVNTNDTTLSGNWYVEMVPLNSRETANGSFSLKRISHEVSDRMWWQRKEKQIIDKLNQTKNRP